MCAPGLEGVVHDELVALGCADTTIVAGGVNFTGDRERLYRVNLWSRTAGRVLRRLDHFVAVSFPELARKTRRLPWAELLPKGAAVGVNASSHGSRLSMRRKIESVIFDTIAERHSIRPSEDGPDVTVMARFDRDECVLSIDTSGELLHRRGYRQQTGRAPIRETLAAAMLALARFDPSEPFVDPMCGAGTFVLEAALWAVRRAPGAARDFAFMRMADHDEVLWRRLLDEARQQERDRPPAPIIGADRSASAAAAAHDNLERAGLADAVEIRQLDIDHIVAPRGLGLVCFNPPYGGRIADPARLRPVYEAAGRAMRRSFDGWRFGIVSERDDLFQRMRLPTRESVAVLHGGKRVRFHTGTVNAGREGRR